MEVRYSNWVEQTNKRKHEEALGVQFEINDEKKKRHRRTANEISRHYKCPVDDCPKSYGSEGSLNQHIKLKHKEYYAANINSSHLGHSVAGSMSMDSSKDYDEMSDSEEEKKPTKWSQFLC